MGLDDKIQDAVGKAKEKIGAATDDPELEAEGQVDQVQSSLDQAKDAAKDAADNAVDAAKKIFD